MMISVFYDGQCGLCAKEINYYRKIAPTGIFNWQDITRSTTELEQAGISLADGLRLLHAKDGAGKLHVGVDAFILMWSQLPYWKILGRLVALPVIRPTANFLYRRFAAWRFSRLAHCQVAAKQSASTHAQEP